MGKVQEFKSADTVERAARVDLAAAFRLAVRLDMHEGVCNHLSIMLPGGAERFLLNRFGLHWSEVTASNLVKLDHVEDDGLERLQWHVMNDES